MGAYNPFILSLFLLLKKWKFASIILLVSAATFESSWWTIMTSSLVKENPILLNHYHFTLPNSHFENEEVLLEKQHFMLRNVVGHSSAISLDFNLPSLKSIISSIVSRHSTVEVSHILSRSYKLLSIPLWLSLK